MEYEVEGARTRGGDVTPAQVLVLVIPQLAGFRSHAHCAVVKHFS